MIPPTPEEIASYVLSLKEAIVPELKQNEAPTFLIRPSVSHEDIEIFLNGRMEAIDGNHFRKTAQSGGVKDRVLVQILPRLRGKRFPFSAYKCSYTVEQVQKEVNWALANILSAIMTEEDRSRFNESIKESIQAVLGEDKDDKDYDSAVYMLMNRHMAKKLVELSKKKTKNG